MGVEVGVLGIGDWRLGDWGDVASASGVGDGADAAKASVGVSVDRGAGDAGTIAVLQAGSMLMTNKRLATDGH